MRRSPAFRAATLATLALFVAGCASTNLPPISAAGGSFQPLDDEVDLWAESRAEEDKLLREVKLYDDPLLADYLQGIVNRLNPPQMAANREVRFKVAVVEDPTLNAFAYPHGSLYVHTGLLARLDNEDQLATVLGHEMTHVENRHMLRYQRSAMNKQIALSVAAVAAAVILAGEEGEAYGDGEWARGAMIGVFGEVLIGLGLQLAFLASVNGYGRDLEIEADHGGFLKLAAAGYDPSEAPRMYEKLTEGDSRSSKAEVFFFGSHPRLAERIASTRQWLAARPPTGDEGGPAGDPESFTRRIRPVIRDDARGNLEMGRLELAEQQLAHVREAMPEDPEAHYLTGRLRLAQADADAEATDQATRRGEARAAFEEAIRRDPKRPHPHRELGLLAYRDQAYPDACREMKSYIDLAPEADDTPRMRDYVLELESEGRC